MKKYKKIFGLFPTCFFIFFSIFIFIKFIFIFFFKTAFEPNFIFELNPFYFLSGINNLQLLLISSVLILSDTYLHIKGTKKSLICSYVPTSFMLIGLVLIIIFREINLSYVYHYFIFSCLLLIILIDHKHILESVKLTEIKPIRSKIGDKKSASILNKPIRADTPDYFVNYQLNSEASKTFEILLQKIQTLFEVLERKTVNLEKLEKEFEENRKNLILHEEMFIDRFINYNKVRDRFDVGDKNLASNNKIFIKDEEVNNNLIIDESNDCIAVVQRGILKQINNSFANFLGYETDEIINKSLFVFLTPTGMENVKNYHLNRLKGIVSNSYNTEFMTKDQNEISVEILVKPIIYKGEMAEILVVKEIKNI